MGAFEVLSFGSRSVRRRVTFGKMARVSQRDFFVAWLIVIHCWITALLILSGRTHLEPLAATYFWAPLISFITVPGRYAHDRPIEFGRFESAWQRGYPFVLASVWILSFTLVPYLIWDKLIAIDDVLHLYREQIGFALGVSGQTGLVLFVMSLITCGTAGYQLFQKVRATRL